MGARASWDVYRGFCRLKQAIPCHANEPLGRGAENNGAFVPPTMGVAVLEGFVAKQHIALRQSGDDAVVGFENVLPPKDRGIRLVYPIATNRIVDFEVVSPTHFKILNTVCRCCMNTASARFRRDMFAQHDGHRVIAEGR